MSVPLNIKLYNKVKKEADKKYDKPSAYKSGWIVKTYKKRGGEYKGKKKKNEGLDRWYKEEWKDIAGLDYPVYRPTKRITKDTPLTESEISDESKKKQSLLKQKIKGKENLPPFEGGNISLTIKEKDDYTKDENEIFSFLSVLGKYSVVGSGSIKEIEYADDYDLLEFVDCKRSQDAYDIVLQVFQEKYRKAERMDNIYITDFKNGMFNGQPVRWTKETIADGFQYIDDKKVYFTEMLQTESIIKMDIVALTDGLFTEFSENYFITFGRFSTYNKRNILEETIISCIRADLRKKIECGKYYKALKRYFSILKLQKTKNKKQFSTIINYLNGEIGLLSHYKGDLETIKEVIINKFRLPPMEDIIRNLEYIKDNIDTPFKWAIQEIIDEKTREKIDVKLCQVIKYLSDIINEKTLQFIKKNNLLLYK